jgi:hypothetical protein
MFLFLSCHIYFTFPVTYIATLSNIKNGNGKTKAGHVTNAAVQIFADNILHLPYNAAADVTN